MPLGTKILSCKVAEVPQRAPDESGLRSAELQSCRVTPARRDFAALSRVAKVKVAARLKPLAMTGLVGCVEVVIICDGQGCRAILRTARNDPAALYELRRASSVQERFYEATNDNRS